MFIRFVFVDESNDEFTRRCIGINMDMMINEEIRDKEIRLIGQNGEQLGIMSARQALEMAEEQELDLVKIAPTAKPPVCKIMDYGKYRFEQSKREKEAEVGLDVMNEFYERVKDHANMDRKPSTEGRTMTMMLSPKQDK